MSALARSSAALAARPAPPTPAQAESQLALWRRQSPPLDALIASGAAGVFEHGFSGGLDLVHRQAKAHKVAAKRH